jgi:autotransporter-associated beta strand protein
MEQEYFNGRGPCRLSAKNPMGNVTFCLSAALCLLAVAEFAHAGNPLWNGAGSATNDNFSNRKNWVAGDAPPGNSLDGLPVDFGPLAPGAVNLANCDATGNSQTWTFDAGAPAMVVTLNGQQLGVPLVDVFVNDSANPETIKGSFLLFDFAPSATRRFVADAGPLAIETSQIDLRGEGAPATWTIEFGGNSGGTFNSAFQNVNDTGTVNYLMSGPGIWEMVSALPDLTASASSLTVSNGVLILDGTNTYSGVTAVESGALVLNNPNALPAGTVLTVADGAVVQPNVIGNYASVPTTIYGSSMANGSFGGSLNFQGNGDQTWPGPITLAGPGATIGSFGTVNNVTLSGPLTGPGGLTIRPEGGDASSHTSTFILSNSGNNYAGLTTITVGAAQNSSTLQLGANNGLPSTTQLSLLHLNPSGLVCFDLAGYNQTLSGLLSDNDNCLVRNSSGANCTLTISNNAAAVFNGSLGALGEAKIDLIKQGTGTLKLSGTNVYTGSATISAGTLVINGLLTAASGLTLDPNATLQLALGPTNGRTNIVVNGNVKLQGVLNFNDFGIVSNAVYPIIYYTGTLDTNGLAVAPQAPWGFQIDTSTAHWVTLVPTREYSEIQFTNGSFAVSSLTTNLGGILRGTPAAGPIWYEVRDQTNRLWDFGAVPALSPWGITVRHLRGGTNTVTVFAQNATGLTQTDHIELVLALGPDSPVRPRPIPSEIWWGGTVDNAQLTNYSQWLYVQKYEDGYFVHGVAWDSSTVWLQQSMAQNLSLYNTKYWPELTGEISNPDTNSAAGLLAANAAFVAGLEANGIIFSELTHDYHMEDMQGVCEATPAWTTNDQIAWWTGDLTVADANDPYPGGIWRDIFSGYYAQFPHVKVGHSSSPVWWGWNDFPALDVDNLAFTVGGRSFAFTADTIFASFLNMASAINHPYFSLQTDCPWDYFGFDGLLCTGAENRQKIRAYEQNLQSRNGRHTLICNVSDAGQETQGSQTAADVYYENSSLSSMYLHQQEGGRANRYLYESWYPGIPYVVVPETQAGSYTHLAMSAIKYLKGIATTNGDLENLSLSTVARMGTVSQLRLQNNGDVPCLPAVAGQAGTVPGVGTRYFSSDGSELTAQVLTGEGFCYTNMLQPGTGTNLFAITLASGLSGPTNDNAALEAFWNPQDPLGIVRSRANFTAPLTPSGPWDQADIGNPGVFGGSAMSGSVATVLGSGGDIGNSSDSFHFLWQTNHGDGVITARVTSQTVADAESKAGVMVRENMAADTRTVYLCVTPQGIIFQDRPVTGGGSVSQVVSGINAPAWLRIIRSGTTFLGESSADGVTWTTQSSTNLPGFADSGLFGLAVTAHNNARASAATFDNIAVLGLNSTVSGKLVTTGPTPRLSLSWPASQLEWRLQVQTNGLNPSNWFDVADPGFTNRVSLPLTPNGAVLYRLVYP